MEPHCTTICMLPVCVCLCICVFPPITHRNGDTSLAHQPTVCDPVSVPVIRLWVRHFVFCSTFINKTGPFDPATCWLDGLNRIGLLNNCIEVYSMKGGAMFKILSLETVVRFHAQLRRPIELWHHSAARGEWSVGFGMTIAIFHYIRYADLVSHSTYD